MKQSNHQTILSYLKAATPPPTLRSKIWDAIENNSTKIVLNQLRVATALSLCLVMITFSFTQFTGNQPLSTDVLDIEPTNTFEILLQQTNGISSDAALQTIFQTY